MTIAPREPSAYLTHQETSKYPCHPRTERGSRMSREPGEEGKDILGFGLEHYWYWYVTRGGGREYGQLREGKREGKREGNRRFDEEMVMVVDCVRGR